MSPDKRERDNQAAHDFADEFSMEELRAAFSLIMPHAYAEEFAVSLTAPEERSGDPVIGSAYTAIHSVYYHVCHPS